MFNHRPNLILELVQPLLHNVPGLMIPVLLKQGVGDDRPLHSHPDNAIRVLDDWVQSALPGTEAPLHRRRTLWRPEIDC